MGGTCVEERVTLLGPLRMDNRPLNLRERLQRVLFDALGWLALGLAAVGVLLPLVPATPFLLLASACFVRSSPRLHAWLMGHPRFGPYLVQWQHDRTVPPRAKRRAYLLVVVSFTVSILAVPAGWLRWLLAGIGAVLLWSLSRLRSGPPPRGSRSTEVTDGAGVRPPRADA